MKRADEAIHNLCESLGGGYVVKDLWGKPRLYCDFGNGFNVQIEGMYTINMRRKATLYLWSGYPWDDDSVVVDVVHKVRREDIYDVVESFRVFSNDLIDAGYVGGKAWNWVEKHELRECNKLVHDYEFRKRNKSFQGWD